MGESSNHGSGSADPGTLIWIKPRLKAMRFPPVGTGAFTAMPYATNDELPPRIRRHLSMRGISSANPSTALGEPMERGSPIAGRRSQTVSPGRR